MMKIKLVLFCLVLNFSCTPRAFEKPPAATPAPPPVTAEEKQASFQTEVQKLRTADLKFIFAFRRTDGAAFDGEDKRFLRTNLPFNNRVVLADEDRAVIVGSNFPFPAENLDALRARFRVEDYSAADQTKQ